MNFYGMAHAVFSLDEGNEESPYLDSKGNWTIGIGHLIGRDLKNLKLSQYVRTALFQEDLQTALMESRRAVGDGFFDTLPPARQIALVSMLFTLGANKFEAFDPTVTAMLKGDWDEVADRILKTKWARDVDPRQRPGEGRDDRIAYMFRTGEFHPDYGIKV